MCLEERESILPRVNRGGGRKKITLHIQETGSRAGLPEGAGAPPRPPRLPG